mmetsp:Transcript_8622/g.8754  ORF Transcript_8622/g.8754 Transcript_8622/m.8754 type:complete len:295 (-) Transcript_8622:35-919(-)
MELTLLIVLLVSLILSSCSSPVKVSSIKLPPGCTETAAGTIYYFGIGSNLLKSKVINRGVNGTKIDLISMVPGIAPKHRLAFNLRGFPPLEPSMAGIEPDENEECHGSLIEMTPENYHKLWASEGGLSPKPGYEQVVVEVFPYSSQSSVRAISLRSAPHVKLTKDRNPSARYLSILIEGAEELGIVPEYVNRLKSIQPAKPSRFLRTLSLYSLLSYSLCMRYKLTHVTRLWSYLTGALYISPSRPLSLRIMSEIMLSVVLLPLALIGMGERMRQRVRGEEMNSMMRSMWKSHSK